jgi:hypothetical protein
MGKLIGYGKLGRSMPLTLEQCGNLGGDVEMVAVVKELALRRPEDDFILVGRNSGETPMAVDLPSNVINPWSKWRGELRDRLKAAGIKGNLTIEEHKIVTSIYRDMMGDIWKRLDGLVLWVGQHGSSNMSIPKIDDPAQWTKPQDWCAFYAGYMLDGVNQFREGRADTHDVVWLNADARNKHKMRDLKHKLINPILTQRTFSHNLKHEQYDGTPPIVGAVHNIYSRLEINGLAPGTPFGDLITYNPNPTLRRYRFGMFINEARAIGVKGGMDRLTVMEQWVMPIIQDTTEERPHWVHGTWSERSQTRLGFEIKPAPWDQYYPMLNDTLCTFTTPSSGSGFATAKPWEAFAGGTICFFHPEYDDQDNILKDAHPNLREWLRVKSPKDLKTRVAAVAANPSTASWLIQRQREHFNRAMTNKTYLKMIEEMIWNEQA